MATTTLRPVDNFETKKVRKAKREVVLKRRVGVRGGLLNLVADRKGDREDKKQFRRNIGPIKTRRRLIARRMAILSLRVGDLMAELRRFEARNPDFTARSLDEAFDLVRSAVASAGTAADEFALFARAKVQYVKEF